MMKRAEHQPETVSLTIYAGIYYRVWRVQDAGTVLPQHAHRWPHLTALLLGSVLVECDGEHVGVFDAPATIRIPADTLHQFTTLTDNVTLACIHNAEMLEADEPAVTAEHTLVLED